LKKIIAAALVTLSLGMPAAFAQSAAPAAAQLDPATVSAVKDLMGAMKFREMMQKSFAQVQQNLPQIMVQGATAAINADTKLTPAQKKEAMASMSKQVPEAVKAFASTMNDPKLMDELSNEIVPLYARHFTADELKAMAAFYRSPVGVKMTQTMPQLMVESMQISQRVLMPRLSAMIQKLSQVKK
jgi:hypothetical protein